MSEANKSNREPRMPKVWESCITLAALIGVLAIVVLESWGRGIGLMISECRRVRIPVPESRTSRSRCGNTKKMWIPHLLKMQAEEVTA